MTTTTSSDTTTDYGLVSRAPGASPDFADTLQKPPRSPLTLTGFLPGLPKQRPAQVFLEYIRSPSFMSDVVAGLTVGLFVVPQSMSYALIAELP